MDIIKSESLIEIAGLERSYTGPFAASATAGDDDDYQICPFDPFVLAVMTLTDGFVALGTNTGNIKIQMKVNPGPYLTHTQDRRVWTGPYLKFRAFDFDGLLVVDWQVAQINLICPQGSPYYLSKLSPVKAKGILRTEVTISGYKYRQC